MGVQRDGVSGEQPHEFSRGKNDFPARIDRFEEEDETHGGGLEITLRFVDQGGIGGGKLQIGDEVPGDRRHGEEDGCDDKSIIIAQLGDQGQTGAERTAGARDFVEDVHEGIHAAQLLHVSAHDIPWNHASDEFHHAIGNAGNAEDRDDPMGVVIAVVCISISFLLLHPVGRLKRTAARGIYDHQDGGEKTEDQNGARQHDPGGISLDQGGDENGPDTLEGLIQASQQTHFGEGAWRHAGLQCIVIVTLRGQGGDGSVEGFEAEFIHHDPGNVDHYIALLHGGE